MRDEGLSRLNAECLGMSANVRETREPNIAITSQTSSQKLNVTASILGPSNPYSLRRSRTQNTVLRLHILPNSQHQCVNYWG